MNIIKSPSIPLESHNARVRNFNSGRLGRGERREDNSPAISHSTWKTDTKVSLACWKQNATWITSMEYECRAFGCSIIALGWEVSRCSLTTGCANTQFAAVPWLPQAGSLKTLCQWQVSKKACYGLLPLRALSLVITEAKTSKSNNSTYFMHFKGAENAQAKINTGRSTSDKIYFLFYLDSSDPENDWHCYITKFLMI